MIKEPIDVVFSFDTTGSMYPALTQVRRVIAKTVRQLFDDIPNIRIGIIAHGDYCDARSSYVTKTLELSSNEEKICRFVSDVGPTGGGDAEECYELVLNEARSLSWSAGKQKVLVMIGDDIPHGVNYSHNTKRLDWRNELDLLLEAGIHVYGVQALNRSHATKFYAEVAKRTGGFHLNLDQFSDVADLILAVCYKQVGDTRLQDYADKVTKAGRMNRGLSTSFGTLLGKKGKVVKYEKTRLETVPPGRFQVLEVDDDTPIADFVLDNGLRFKTGRGFYEFKKSVLVQEHKEVVLMDRRTGDLYTGDYARNLIGLPYGERGNISPRTAGLDDKYLAFIQSTSANRKLLGGTRFLYEVDDYE